MPQRIVLLLCLLIVSFVSTGCRGGPVTPVFEIPALIGQDIEAIATKLGKPSREENHDGMPTKVWIKDNSTLSISYKPLSKRVTAFTLISRDEGKAVREEAKSSLLDSGSLTEGDARYSMELVEASTIPFRFVGVKVIPAPRTYDVVLRVTAASALLAVGYQIAGGQGRAEQFLTLAPWEKSFRLPDDARISLSSRVYKSMGAAGFWMQTEILVDGKVVCSNKTSGVPVACKWEL